MNFSKRDYNETKELSHLIRKIESIDKHYVDAITDELYQYQPFLLSILLGYQYDLKPPEVEEIMKIYFIIWEYFKDKKNIKTKKLLKNSLRI